MSNYYSNLVEKIEKQNSYSQKDKMEIQYQIRDVSLVTQRQLKENGKALKVIIVFQMANIGANHTDMLAQLLKILL